MDSNESAIQGLLGPVKEAGFVLWSLVPKNFDFRKPHFNFITVHYMYIIGCTIAGSVILYGGDYMSYINALFFAAGCTTQSGLNPININDLFLYQQVVMMLIACICNPIFINTAVVFVRLYWFEKRFERVVKESREQRKSRSRISRSRSQMKDIPDPEHLERGVNGRQIRVLHHTTAPNGMSGKGVGDEGGARKEFAEKMGLAKEVESESPSNSGESQRTATAADAGNEEKNTAVDHGNEDSTPAAQQPFHRDIMFADELPEPAPLDTRTQETQTVDTPTLDTRTSEERAQPRVEQMAETNDMLKHIEFLQKQQREAQGGPALRIPGPRDFDRGEVPQQLHTPENERPNRLALQHTTSSADVEREVDREDNEEQTEHINLDDHGPERTGGIRFDDQEHPARRDWAARRSNEQHGTTTSRSGPDFVGRLRSRQSKLSLSETRESIGRTFSSFSMARSRERPETAMPYLSYEPTIGRNSAFVSLTNEQRDELGGIEYRALKTLALVLIYYYVGFHVLGMMFYLPWILHTKRWRQIVVSDGIDAGWWGVFTPASMFTDLGFTLTPNSMNSFATSTYVLLIGAILIVIGNTGFPVMLRFMIWIGSKIVPYGGATWEELRFLLDHPRRCFTLLFPSRATWWLFWILITLNGIDLIFYIILDINVSAVDAKPANYRVLDGFFQATSTRTAGFSCVNLANLHPAIQVSYMVMMYISVFPIAISVRRTNVYEERSLGIWGGEEVTDGGGGGGSGGNDQSYVPQHLRRQLSFDLWYVFLGFFIICIVEGGPLQSTDKPAWTLFAVLFEIVSAYGTVGLSLGYPGTDTSFSAQFSVISKLVIAAMMIRGRHRGLPYALDRAILLPSENLQKKEQEDAERRYGGGGTGGRRGSVFAENNTGTTTFQRGETWSDFELDANGLPRQHLGNSRPVSTGAAAQAGEDAETEGAGGVGERAATLSFSRSLSRRGSGLSNTGGEGVGRGKHERSRSLSRVLAGGLSAGPTLPKRE